MKTFQICDRVSIIALSLSVFLGLAAFLPGGFLPTSILKGYLLVACVLVALVSWLLGRLIEGVFRIPWTRMLVAMGGMLLALLLSALFSNATYLTFFGEGFDVGTFAVIGSLILSMFLISTLFTTRRRVFTFLQTFFLVYIVLALYQLVHVFFPAQTSFGIFTSRVDSPVGLWNDFAFLSGAALIGFIIVIEFMKPARLMKIIAIIGAILSFFFLVLTNILMAWVLVGFSAIVVLIYILITNRFAEKRHFPFLSFSLSLIALLFVLANNLFGPVLSSRLNTSFIDIHPSIQSSVHVAGLSLREDPVFGPGPNTFLNQWLVHRPWAANIHTLWDVPFTSGSSFMMTTAVLSGALGILACLLFLYAYAYESSKKVFLPTADHKTSTPVLGIFLFSLYFLLAIIFASPGIAIVICAFSFMGLLFGSLVGEKRIPERTVNFLKDQRISFFSILCIVALLMIAAGTAYASTERFASIIFFEKGLASANVSDIDKANKRLSQAISLADLPLFERTRVLFAEEAVRKTLGLSTKDVTPDTVRSMLQASIGLGNSSAKQAVALNPQDPANYLALGDFLRILYPLKIDGLYDGAKDAYNQAITLAPHYPKSYLGLAQLYFDAKDTKNARVYIQKALAEKPNYTDAYFLLAQIETADGNDDAALKRIEDTTMIDPNNPDTYFHLGVLHYNRKEYTDAIGALRTTIALNNQYLNAWYFLALCDQKTGATTEANDILTKLHAAFPTNDNITSALNGNPNTTTDATPLPTNGDTTQSNTMTPTSGAPLVTVPKTDKPKKAKVVKPAAKAPTTTTTPATPVAPQSTTR